MLIGNRNDRQIDEFPRLEPVLPVNTLPTNRPAANTVAPSQSDPSKRRQRRLRRQGRVQSRAIQGWTLRSW